MMCTFLRNFNIQNSHVKTMTCSRTNNNMLEKDRQLPYIPSYKTIHIHKWTPPSLSPSAVGLLTSLDMRMHQVSQTTLDMSLSTANCCLQLTADYSKIWMAGI